MKIYEGQNKEPFRGVYDKKVIKSVSTTKNGFERDLVINRTTGSFTDQYFVIHHGKQETAWINRGSCNSKFVNVCLRPIAVIENPYIIRR